MAYSGNPDPSFLYGSTRFLSSPPPGPHGHGRHLSPSSTSDTSDSAEDFFSFFFDVDRYYGVSAPASSSRSSSHGLEYLSDAQSDRDFLARSPTTPRSSTNTLDDSDSAIDFRHSQFGSSPPLLSSDNAHTYTHTHTHTLARSSPAVPSRGKKRVSNLFPQDHTDINDAAYLPQLQLPASTAPIYPTASYPAASYPAASYPAPLCPQGSYISSSHHWALPPSFSPTDGYHGMHPESSGYASSRSSPRPSKKSRIVADPEKTQDVRRTGACLHCRVGRLACNTSNPCDKCKALCKKLGSPLEREVCIRKQPNEILGSRGFRWELDEYDTRDWRQFPSKMKDTFVSFEQGVEASCLRVPVARVNVSYGFAGAVFDMDPNPEKSFLDKILHWAEKHEIQMASEVSGDFEADFEAKIAGLLGRYVRQDPLGRLGQQSGKVRAAVQACRTLMKSLLNLTLMWRVWTADELYVRHEPGHSWAWPMPDHLQSVAERLKRIAARSMAEEERRVLDQLDLYLDACREVKENKHGAVWGTLNVAMWIALMQLMLLYRKSLKACGQPCHPDASAKVQDFMRVTRELFVAVAVIHSELFRTIKVLQSLGESALEAFGGDEDLGYDFDEAWDDHFVFYEGFKRPGHEEVPGDEVFLANVVVREEKVFGRRRPNQSYKRS